MLITHRLRSLCFAGKQAHVVTTGGANIGTEQWTAGKDGEVAVVRNRLPKLGYVLSWMRSVPGRIALA